MEEKGNLLQFIKKMIRKNWIIFSVSSKFNLVDYLIPFCCYSVLLLLLLSFARVHFPIYLRQTIRVLKKRNGETLRNIRRLTINTDESSNFPSTFLFFAFSFDILIVFFFAAHLHTITNGFSPLEICCCYCCSVLLIKFWPILSVFFWLP